MTDIWKIPVIEVTKIARNANVRMNEYSVGELNESDHTCGSIWLLRDLWTHHTFHHYLRLKNGSLGPSGNCSVSGKEAATGRTLGDIPDVRWHYAMHVTVCLHALLAYVLQAMRNVLSSKILIM